MRPDPRFRLRSAFRSFAFGGGFLAPLLSSGCLFISDKTHDDMVAAIEGCADPTIFHADADGDGFGTPNTIEEACAAPDGFVANADDCDDGDPTASPDGTEACDGRDNDCDGTVDGPGTPGWMTWYADTDGDGWGDEAAPSEACQAPGTTWSLQAGDCDDGDMERSPDVPETCDDKDNDCNGTVDDEPTDGTTWYADNDLDSFGDPAVATVACNQPKRHVADDTDCDDTTASIHPGAPEICDAVDTDCDGVGPDDQSSDALTWYEDADVDGYGNASSTTLACELPVGYVPDFTDCDDADDQVHPDADERCSTGVDDDCDGFTNEDDATDTVAWHYDADGDAYGGTSLTVTSCLAPTSDWVADATDCDDGDGVVHPGATEVCNGEDENCSGVPDEAFADADLDGTADCVDVCPVYADPTASSGGDGSLADPYDSLNSAQALRGSYCDEIGLLAGTYYESIDYGGDDLHVFGVDGADLTILDGSTGTGALVVIANGETSAAILEDVTLTGGTGEIGDGYYFPITARNGGGLFVSSADPTIRNVRIVDNSATGYGGGAAFADFDGEFLDNEVEGNVASRASDLVGGGMYMIDSTGDVIGNQFLSNSTTWSGADGAGLQLVFGGSAIVQNWFEANDCSSDGGGLHLYGTTSLVANNVFLDNTTDGIAAAGSDESDLVNNTLVDNDFGFYLYLTLNRVVNNIVSGSVFYGAYVHDDYLVEWAYNDVWDSGYGQYAIMTSATGLDGNISADPAFTNEALDDFTLTSASPAKDSGTTATSYGVSDDFEGTVRPTGGGWDMGAYEQ